jgi:L-threonylcarbamoyladenylate synthase
VAGTDADVDVAVAALRAGEVVVLPTDTVYGLAASAESITGVRRLYALKGRAEGQPTALVAASVEALLLRIPELADLEAVLRRLLPGPYTLVLPNPLGRYPSLCAPGARSIGVRVPAVAGPPADLLERAGAVAATSANLPGGRDPRLLADVPAELLAVAGAVLDGGKLPGTASTVLDLTGPEPRVLRAGAIPAVEALERARGAAR